MEFHESETVAAGGVRIEAPSDTARKTYVHGALDEVEKQIEKAHKALAMLGERLTPVLRPPEPESLMEGGAAEDRVPVPLADRIDNQATSLRMLVGQMHDLVGRLEV